MKDKVFDTLKDLGKIVGVGSVVTVICSVLMFHVWNRYQITHMGYEIARVTKEHQSLVEQNRKLSIEVAVQGRTERMTEVARARFGLQPTQPDQIQPVMFQAHNPSDSTDQERHAALER
jgi:cell division protein FtsL